MYDCRRRVCVGRGGKSLLRLPERVQRRQPGSLSPAHCQSAAGPGSRADSNLPCILQRPARTVWAVRHATLRLRQTPAHEHRSVTNSHGIIIARRRTSAVLATVLCLSVCLCLSPPVTSHHRHFICPIIQQLAAWRSGTLSGVRRMNEVNPRRARLVLGLVTVSGKLTQNKPSPCARKDYKLICTTSRMSNIKSRISAIFYFLSFSVYLGSFSFSLQLTKLYFHIVSYPQGDIVRSVRDTSARGHI